jgi:hypothetical protein
VVKSHKEHVHVLERGGLLIELTLKDGVIHQVNTCHTSYDIGTLIGKIIPVVTSDTPSGVHDRRADDSVDIIHSTVSATVLV